MLLFESVRRVCQGSAMAFVRRKGNAFYLVHNVRRGGKVQQLHLARLGEHARITDDIVREVNKKHPFVELNWRSLREQLNNQIDLADPESPAVVDRKSTRLNSSHDDISYAVFCLKYKTTASPSAASCACRGSSAPANPAPT